MADQLQPRIASAGQGKTALVFGVRVDILLTGEDTGGSHSVYEVTAAPGTGAPPHVHQHDDETFYVLEGELEVLLGNERKRIGPGNSIFLPHGVPHAFCNPGAEPVRFLGTATPAGHEHFFLAADQLVREGRFNPETGAEVCREFGIELLVP